MARVTAGARVRVAAALARMPSFAEALAGGRICEGHVRAAARCLGSRTAAAFAGSEPMLVGMAVEFGVDDFDRLVSRWLLVHDPDGADPGGPGAHSQAYVARSLGGRLRIDADLDLADGQEFRAELDTLADEELRADEAAGAVRPRAERLGAAMAEMARRSSATRRPRPDGIDPGRNGSLPRRPQLTVVVPLDALGGHPDTLATLDDGTPVPPEVLQRWACDSHIGRVVTAGASAPVDLGRLTRTATPAQRRALVARDGGCVVDGCGRPARWCHAHHVVPWTADGPTDLHNLALVCTRHHTLLHAEDPPIELRPHADSAGRWRAVRPDGTPLTPLRRQRPPPLPVP